MNLHEYTRDRVLVGDGAMGTLLYQRGFPLTLCYDELCLTRPDDVRRIHEDYAAAGADIVETNTFGANSLRLARFGLEKQVRDINLTGVRLARDAVGNRALVAGSVGALGEDTDKSLTPEDRVSIYREQIAALAEGEVDLLILETFTSLSDLLIALKVVKTLTDKPVLCQMSFNEDARTSAGDYAPEAFETLTKQGADAVGTNCMGGPVGISRVLDHIEIKDGRPILSVFPNAGLPELVEGRYIYLATPDYFAETSRQFVEKGARIVGGCCGTGPEHIAAIASAVKDLQPIAVKVALRVEIPPKPAEPEPSRSILDVMDSRTLIICELDPPKNLNSARVIRGSAALKEAGVDCVTLGDNSLAITCISNTAMGHLIQSKVGVTPLIHISCRDKNKIGLQSTLMGLYALGLDHVLAISGDPARIGDQPHAKSVYDINSLGLIEMISRLNQGISSTGKQWNERTDFKIAAAFNPNVSSISAQVARLKKR